jgi:hypothetical protein
MITDTLVGLEGVVGRENPYLSSAAVANELRSCAACIDDAQDADCADLPVRCRRDAGSVVRQVAEAAQIVQRQPIVDPPRGAQSHQLGDVFRLPAHTEKCLLPRAVRMVKFLPPRVPIMRGWHPMPVTDWMGLLIQEQWSLVDKEENFIS